MTEKEYHAQLLKRFDDAETTAKELCSEAFQKGDHETVAFCGKTLERYKQMRDTLRPPREGVEFVPPINNPTKSHE